MALPTAHTSLGEATLTAVKEICWVAPLGDTGGDRSTQTTPFHAQARGVRVGVFDDPVLWLLPTTHALVWERASTAVRVPLVDAGRGSPEAGPVPPAEILLPGNRCSFLYHLRLPEQKRAPALSLG